MTRCALFLDACFQLQQSTFQYSQASSQLSYVAKERLSPWPTAALWTLTTFCMVTCRGPLTRMGRDLNLDTRLYLLHGNCLIAYLRWAPV